MHSSIWQSVAAFCARLEDTPFSLTIQATKWIVPAVQSVHILAIAVVASSALMINLRLFGIFGATSRCSIVDARFLPFIWWSLLVLLAHRHGIDYRRTGAFAAEPGVPDQDAAAACRHRRHPHYRSARRRNARFRDTAAPRRGGAKALAVALA